MCESRYLQLHRGMAVRVWHVSALYTIFVLLPVTQVVNQPKHRTHTAVFFSWQPPESGPPAAAPRTQDRRRQQSPRRRRRQLRPGAAPCAGVTRACSGLRVLGACARVAGFGLCVSCSVAWALQWRRRAEERPRKLLRSSRKQLFSSSVPGELPEPRLPQAAAAHGADVAARGARERPEAAPECPAVSVQHAASGFEYVEEAERHGYRFPDSVQSDPMLSPDHRDIHTLKSLLGRIQPIHPHPHQPPYGL